MKKWILAQAGQNGKIWVLESVLYFLRESTTVAPANKGDVCMKNLFYLLYKSFLDIAPLVVVILFFQLVIIAEPFEDPLRLVTGVLLVVFGLFLFMRGLEAGLFPLGNEMAFSFAKKGSVFWLLLFAFCIGFATTIAEPSLMAIAIKAEEITGGSISYFGLRLAVAIGVATGISIGVLRIILGHPIHYYFIAGYFIVMIMTLFAPPDIIGLAYDSGGVTTSSVTVPLVTALGIGLANSIAGRTPLLDGFGLIAFASLAPMVSVMGYGILVL